MGLDKLILHHINKIKTTTVSLKFCLGATSMYSICQRCSIPDILNYVLFAQMYFATGHQQILSFRIQNLKNGR